MKVRNFIEKKFNCKDVLSVATIQDLFSQLVVNLGYAFPTTGRLTTSLVLVTSGRVTTSIATTSFQQQAGTCCLSCSKFLRVKQQFGS